MKKGTEPAYPISRDIIEMCGEKPNPFGMSIRLKIASDAMCAMLSNSKIIDQCEMSAVLKSSVMWADALIEMEEEGNK